MNVKIYYHNSGTKYTETTKRKLHIYLHTMDNALTLLALLATVVDLLVERYCRLWST